MNLADLPDFIGVLFGFVLTVLIFTYLIGDNPFFRFATHVFIGVASGFALVIVIYNVFLTQLFLPVIQQPVGSLILVPPLVLGIWMLLTKPWPRFSRLGNVPVAFLVGAGAAAALGGAVLGTLFPQISASAAHFDIQTAQQAGINVMLFVFQGLFVLVGTITTLVFFHFGIRSHPDRSPSRHPLVEELARVGQVFIAITFGAIFAGVYAAALTALIERLAFITDRFLPLIFNI
jgi:hypothetical protein